MGKPRSIHCKRELCTSGQKEVLSFDRNVKDVVWFSEEKHMKNSQKCYDNLTLMVVLEVAYGIFGQPAAAGIVTKVGTGTDLTAGATAGTG